MDERDHHDEFYLREAARIFDAPLFTEVRRRMAGFLTRYGRSSAGDRVLSLGCGDGRVECLMAPLVGEIVGIELSPVAVELAQARAAHSGAANVRFEVGDIQALAVSPGSFDAVWALGVLHHLREAEVEDLLRRSRAALRPGGIFVSNDPSAGRLVGLFKGLFARAYQAYHSPDERELEAGPLRTLFGRAGFAPVSVHYNDFFLGPLSWLFPQCPASLVFPLAAFESLLLRVPVLHRTASSFCVVARNPTS